MENEEKIQEIAGRYNDGTISLIGVLQETSKSFGYLPEEVLNELSAKIDVPISRMYSLATFYSSFRLEPIGREHADHQIFARGIGIFRIADNGDHSIQMIERDSEALENMRPFLRFAQIVFGSLDYYLVPVIDKRLKQLFKIERFRYSMVQTEHDRRESHLHGRVGI